MKCLTILVVLTLAVVCGTAGTAAPVEKSGSFVFVQLADTQLGMANVDDAAGGWRLSHGGLRDGCSDNCGRKDR